MVKNKYLVLIKSLKSIFDNSTPLSIQAKMSISASMLGSNFPNWIFCGYYVVAKKHILEIGPYYGSMIPCTHIKYGMGVCGTVAKKRRTIIVNNVQECDNYIACDSDTKSEIVIPVFKKEKLIAVLDIDSIIENDFKNIDRINLEKICSLIAK